MEGREEVAMAGMEPLRQTAEDMALKAGEAMARRQGIGVATALPREDQ